MPRFVLPIVFLLLGYGFWTSPHFTEIAAGIALFLFGMISLENGFKGFTGGTLETILRHSTDRRWKSLGFGIIATTLMQSSTLVSLVTISFVSANLISLAAGIGVIMGANLGTTTGAWLIASLGLRVNIAAYAMPLLVFGVILLFGHNRSRRHLGHLLLGIGFLFLGIHYMKLGFEGLQDGFSLADYAVPGLLGLLLFTAIGTLITVIMQSSHATLLVIIAALAAGQVTYDNALALAIGANLGSAFTTALGGITANLGGKRLAVAHVLFNVLTATVAIIAIGPMGWMVEVMANGLGIADDDLLLRLALFHTLFNLLGVLLLWPWVPWLERVLTRTIVGQPQTLEQPRFLNPTALETPTTALNAIQLEVNRLYENAHDLIAHGLSLRRAVIDSEHSLSQAVTQTRRIMPLDLDDAYEQRIKVLHNAIIAFIAETQRNDVPEPQVERLYQLQQASRDVVEAVKAIKHMHKNLARYGVSPYPVIRQPYDAMRLQLAKLLRDLRQLRQEEPDAVTRLSLDALKMAMQTSNRQLIRDINRMVRDRHLSPAIATSMMNDEAYAYTLAENLIAANQVLLVGPDQAESQIEQHFSLSPEEMAQLPAATQKQVDAPQQEPPRP